MLTNVRTIPATRMRPVPTQLDLMTVFVMKVLMGTVSTVKVISYRCEATVLLGNQNFRVYYNYYNDTDIP
jgi:hypothetical protein